MVINHLHLHPGMILQIRWVFDQQNLYFLTLTVFTEFSPEKSPDEKRLRNISPPSLDPSHNEYDLSSQVNQNWLMVEPTHLKNITVVKLGSSSPIFGMKIKKCLSCHHPEKFGFRTLGLHGAVSQRCQNR